eukprot:TRINITY_DN1172_c2_g1_i2.p1 TRINITY_DN1172_c2_g1~~TRINITY_DN1172_c2_g1_i2.p1  ORF type:complete len:382 (+),score=145.34 TRINITY_DN1172_c2_g1_i2:470-1615(+)
MGSDWVQGAYLYALYQSYQFEKSQIALLFVAGFLSSAFFGSIVGSLADKFGRKRMSLAFGFVYMASSITKWFPSFSVLLLGRLLGGIATSLLFSVFESWMISEHNSRGFDSELLSETFSLSSFANGIVAIVSGLVASFVVSLFGVVSPYGVSIILLGILIYVVNTTWTENYGSQNTQLQNTFTDAFRVLISNRNVFLLCLIQSAFESSMYIFVFLWTPTLEAGDDNKAEAFPHGIIFACFMVSVMIGSSVFNIFIEKKKWTPEFIGTILLSLAILSTASVIFMKSWYPITIAFFVFEACCGMYWPCFGMLRSKVIPESCRAGIMNLSRIPLNLMVVSLLSQVGKQDNSSTFVLSSMFLVGAFVLHRFLTPPPAEELQHSLE